MLVFTRKCGGGFKIGDNITIKILGIAGGSVRIGIEAPRDIPVHREEVLKRIELAKEQSK